MSSFVAGGGSAFALLALAFALPAQSHAQWDLEESHTTASLRGIHNVGGGVAWASGTNGTVLRTEDGGYLWQTCAIPLAGTKDTSEKLDFRGIQAFDENTAIVMSSGPGDQSRLYKTTDGCQTWKLLFTNPDKDGFWDAVQFIDPKTGFLLGDPVRERFVLMGTYDGGNHWIRAEGKSIGPETPKSRVFAASNSSLFLKDHSVPGFVTGGPGGAFSYEGILEPTCWPKTDYIPPAKCLEDLLGFQQLKLPILGSNSSSGGFSISAADLSQYRAVVVGGDYTKPDQASNTAARLDRRFEGWLPADTPPHGYRSAVAYDAPTKSWITVGPNGTDISTDDGRNWRPLTPTPSDAPDADKNWNALSLPFVVGPHGRIGKLRTNALPDQTQGPVKK